MDREDLLTPEGQRFVHELSELQTRVERERLPVTSWYGGLPEPRVELTPQGLKHLARLLLRRPMAPKIVGAPNRGGDDYESIPGIRDDDRHPWFLFWEAYWVMTRGPQIDASMRLLDAGGTASLFSSYLASLGPEVHSVDLNPTLVEAGKDIARRTGWNLHSYSMDMTALEFPDEHFDHAYSICVFEHLHAELRRAALTEIARVLKPGGVLCITFDYRGKGVALAGQGFNYDRENLLQNVEDVYRHFLGTGLFELYGNPEFIDNGKSYLVWPTEDAPKYTFAAIFLQKKG